MLRTDIVRPIPRNLSTLQAGRAVAAVLVVFFHNSVAIFALKKYWGTEPFGRLFDFGDSGVFFFFVLSGFIILHAHYQDIGHPERVQIYLWRRFRRIYPIYWIVLLLVLPVYFSIDSFGYGFETHPEIILTSILLVHFASPNAVLVVSWTLFHEILFFALFALAIWREWLGLAALGLWLGLSIVSMAIGYSSMAATFYFSHLHLLFGFGMAACWWLKRRPVPLPGITTLLGVTVFLLAGVDEVCWKWLAADWRTLLFGLGATMAMMGIVELECQARLRIPAWLRLLGDASYSIYLTHFLTLSLLAKLTWFSGAARLMPSMLAYVLLAGLAIAVGVLCHLRVERPLLALLGQKHKSAPQLRAGLA